MHGGWRDIKNDLLLKSLINSSVLNKNDYSYLVNPITDGIPRLEPELLSEISNEMIKIIEKYKPFDRIVTIEAMGIPLAAIISYKMKIPFTIIRKRSYDYKDEIKIRQVTGYSNSDLYINGLSKGDRIVIVDDILSTGGTMKAVIFALLKIGVVIKSVIVPIEKKNISSILQKEIDIPFISLCNIEIIDGKVKIIDK